MDAEELQFINWPSTQDLSCISCRTNSTLLTSLSGRITSQIRPAASPVSCRNDSTYWSVKKSSVEFVLVVSCRAETEESDHQLSSLVNRNKLFSVLELCLNLLLVLQFYGSSLVPGLAAHWQLTSLCLSVCFAQRSRCRKPTSDLWRLISEVKCSHSRRRRSFTPAAFQSERVDWRPGGQVEPVGPVSCRESNPRPLSRSWRHLLGLLKVSASVPQILSWNNTQPLWL